MTEQQPIQLTLKDPNEAVMLLGISDANLKLIEETYDIQMITRGDSIVIVGNDEQKAEAAALIEQLLKVIRKDININQRDVVSAIEMSKAGTVEYFAELYDEVIARNTKGKLFVQKQLGNAIILKRFVIKTLYLELDQLERVKHT